MVVAESSAQWVIGQIFTPHHSWEGLPWPLVFSFFCWMLWKRRNGWVFDQVNVTKHDWLNMVRSATSKFSLFKSVAKVPMSFGTPKPTWQPPQPPFLLKANVDGSWEEDTLRVGLGCVIRDARGNWMWGFQLKMLANSAEIAKLFCLRKALKEIIDRGWRNVLLESDCANIVQFINDHHIYFLWKLTPYWIIGNT